MGEIKDFIFSSFFPKSYLDVLLWAIVLMLFIFCGSIWKISVRSIKNLFLIILLSISIPIIYATIPVFIIPKLQSFNDTDIGILIADFTGSEAKEEFGNKGFENRLKSEIKNQATFWGFDKIVSVKSVSWQIDSHEMASVFRRKFNAKCVIWGELSKLNEEIEVFYHIKWIPLGRKLIFPFKEIDFGPIVFMRSGPIIIQLDSTFSESVDYLCDNIWVDIVPFMTATLTESHPDVLINFVKNYKNIISYEDNNIWIPDLMYTIGTIYQNRGDSHTALDFYKQAFEKICQLYDIKNIRSDYKSEDIVKYTERAATYKFQQAFIEVRIGDSSSAISSMIMAACIDSSFVRSSFKNYSLILDGSPNLSVEFDSLPQCFAAKNDFYKWLIGNFQIEWKNSRKAK